MASSIAQVVDLLSGVMATFEVLMDPQQETVVKPQAWADYNRRNRPGPGLPSAVTDPSSRPGSPTRTCGRHRRSRGVAAQHGVPPEQATERMWAAMQGFG